MDSNDPTINLRLRDSDNSYIDSLWSHQCTALGLRGTLSFLPLAFLFIIHKKSVKLWAGLCLRNHGLIYTTSC